MDFDPEAFGAAIGELIRDAVAPLQARIDGMQAKLDKAVSFAGDWQSSMNYAPGSLVRHGQETFVSVKHVKAGAAFTSREGSGWERIF